MVTKLRRLLPDPAEIDPAEQIRSLDLVSLAHDDRPYTVTNFALTVDGRATIDGRSGPIGSETDTAVLVGLRTRVDAVMIGAGTMRVERYGPPVADPAKRERREREGLPHHPLMVIVSDSLELPWDAELFTAGQGRVLIFTSSDRDPPETATPVKVERHDHTVDLVAAMRHLRRERGVRALLSEGGPHLHAQLVAAELVDELFITVAPKLQGGAGPGLVEGLPERTRGLELAWLLADEGELFARYRYVGGSAASANVGPSLASENQAGPGRREPE
jgi:riboflavin-specific deaminase-like protein